MKKIFVIVLTIVLVVAIYLINLDRKVFFVVFGDSISLGKTDSGFTEKNYNSYVVDYLSNQKILEKYIDAYTSSGLRINDIINDIDNNEKVIVENKNYSLKNLLIKADLVTISINNDDVLNKLNGYYRSDELYNWIDELTEDYEEMLSLLREYCKETIIIVGYYIPNTISQDSQLIRIISYLNDAFKEISSLYKVEYIDPSNLLKESENLMGQYYPTELGYKAIGEQIISKLQK